MCGTFLRAAVAAAQGSEIERGGTLEHLLADNVASASVPPVNESVAENSVS